MPQEEKSSLSAPSISGKRRVNAYVSHWSECTANRNASKQVQLHLPIKQHTSLHTTFKEVNHERQYNKVYGFTHLTELRHRGAFNRIGSPAWEGTEGILQALSQAQMASQQICDGAWWTAWKIERKRLRVQAMAVSKPKTTVPQIRP